MRNGSHVLNHNDFQAGSLQGADRSLASLAGALNIDLNGLQARPFLKKLLETLFSQTEITSPLLIR